MLRTLGFQNVPEMGGPVQQLEGLDKTIQKPEKSKSVLTPNLTRLDQMPEFILVPHKIFISDKNRC